MSTTAQTIHDELPPRRRRRLVTPATAGLAAVLIAALGFFAGVEVQKGQGNGSSSGATGGFANAAARAGGFGRFAGGAAGAGGGAAAGGLTVGTIAHKRGNTLYVTDSSGKTVRVRATANSKVTRNAAGSPRSLYPGDTVLVVGKAAANGTVTATRITATSKSAASAGGGRPGAFFGGGAAPSSQSGG